MRGIFRRLPALFAAVVTFVLMGVPVFAMPNTGDGSGSMLPVIYGLILVGIILIVVYVLLLKKKKR